MTKSRTKPDVNGDKKWKQKELMTLKMTKKVKEKIDGSLDDEK